MPGPARQAGSGCSRMSRRPAAPVQRSALADDAADASEPGSVSLNGASLALPRLTRRRQWVCRPYEAATAASARLLSTHSANGMSRLIAPPDNIAAFSRSNPSGRSTGSGPYSPSAR